MPSFGPRNTQELSEVLRLCHDRDQAVVVHGGLTGLVDGAQTASKDIVVSTELMNEIESIDPIARTMTVQAGVKLQQIHELAESNGLLFPLDLGARGSVLNWREHRHECRWQPSDTVRHDS